VGDSGSRIQLARPGELRLATDPVCGMKVDRAKALSAKHAGRTYYFCSEDCLQAFEQDPKRYAGPTPPREGAAAHAH
jgi:P-type Cu+ transporter